MLKFEEAPKGNTCNYHFLDNDSRCGKPADVQMTFYSNESEFESVTIPLNCYCREHGELKRREMDWEREGGNNAEDSIICPYCDADCGTYETESGDYETDFKCEDCGNTFALEIEVRVDYTYSTHRRAEDMPKDWKTNNN